MQWVLKHLAEHGGLAFVRLHPAAHVSRHIINKHKGTNSVGSRTCPRHTSSITMLHWWGGMFWIMSSSFASPAWRKNFHPIISLQVWLCLICPDAVVPQLQRFFFRWCLENADLVFLFLRFTNELHLAVKPLYSLWWNILLIVDSDTTTPTSWSVFLIWQTLVNGIFLHQGQNCSVIQDRCFLWSSGSFATSEFAGVFLFFLKECSELLIWPHATFFAVSLMCLSWSFSLTAACFTASSPLFRSPTELPETGSKCKHSTLETI